MPSGTGMGQYDRRRRGDQARILFTGTLDIRSGEGVPLGLLCLHAFFTGLSLLYFETAANTLFLSHFESKDLPYVYVAIAGVSVIVGSLFSRPETHLSPSHLLYVLLAVMVLGPGTFYIGLRVLDSHWLSMGMMIWKEIHVVLSLIEFWAVAGFLFNIRQGKPLFGLAGSARFLGEILGGFATPLLYIVLGIVAGWVGTGLILRTEYLRVLASALSRRRLAGEELVLNDATSWAILEKQLQSENPDEVIYAARLLEETGHPQLGDMLARLLDHQVSLVRHYGLERIETLSLVDKTEAVLSLIHRAQPPTILSRGLRTLCALSETNAFDAVEPYLEHEEREVRLGAMVGLLQHGGIEGVLHAGQLFNGLKASPDPTQRALAAEVLGEVSIPSFYRPLLELLDDAHPAVQRVALQAAGKLRNSRLIPSLLQALQVPSAREVAASALIAFQEAALPELRARLNAENTSREARICLVQVCSKIGGDSATEVLFQQLHYPDKTIRGLVL